jgi:hypothetical protein
VDAILEAACAALTPRTPLAYLRPARRRAPAAPPSPLPDRGRSVRLRPFAARHSHTAPSASPGTCFCSASTRPTPRRSVRLPRRGRSRSGSGDEEAIFEEKAAEGGSEGEEERWRRVGNREKRRRHPPSHRPLPCVLLQRLLRPATAAVSIRAPSACPATVAVTGDEVEASSERTGATPGVAVESRQG